MKRFAVKNFERFQHYRDRKPVWIKLYTELLEDYEFGTLPDASKAHLLAIWLLASRNDNNLPWDSNWIAKRISATDDVDLTALARAGFIKVIQEDTEEPHGVGDSCYQDASDLLADSSADAIVETETELEPPLYPKGYIPPTGGSPLPRLENLPVSDGGRRTYPDAFEEFWRAYPVNPNDTKASAYKAWRKAANRRDVSISDLLSGAQRYAAHVDGWPKDKRRHVQTWVNAEGWTATYETAPKRTGGFVPLGVGG